jgi:hypothetical protein
MKQDAEYEVYEKLIVMNKVKVTMQPYGEGSWLNLRGHMFYIARLFNTSAYFKLTDGKDY